MNAKIRQKIVLDIIKARPASERALLNIARKIAGEAKLPPPEKSEILAQYRRLIKSKQAKSNRRTERLLTKRAVRTLSGVAVVSVLTKPLPCPGRCLYCPTEKGMPKSYLSNEPAVMRAILNDFDPYRQVAMRLKALRLNGHNIDKIELIVMGGTWSSHSPRYQSWFIRRCLEAVNGHRAKTLEAAQKQNETARRRCVGLTLETRPDYIDEKEIKRMRKLGATRVELGIQHTDEKILKRNQRGHSAKQSVRAVRLLKEAGFKINYHLMLNLPGATPAQDLAMVKKIYTSPDWMPDMVKIYPCVVTKNSDLYKLWRQSKYRPYSQKQLLKLIIKIKKITPPWVRITRLIRDIPETSIVAGNKTSNLRQLIQEQSQRDGWHCQCLRCREAGHQNKNFQFSIFNFQKIKIRALTYRASNGTEYFLSFDSPDGKVLYAFLRLRINAQKNHHFIPELANAAIVRELHTYGQVAALGETGEVQHLGLGRKLLAEAEKITRQNGLARLAVISGIGVREYYRQNGYNLEGSYMIKEFVKP